MWLKLGQSRQSVFLLIQPTTNLKTSPITRNQDTMFWDLLHNLHHHHLQPFQVDLSSKYLFGLDGGGVLNHGLDVKEDETCKMDILMTNGVKGLSFAEAWGKTGYILFWDDIRSLIPSAQFIDICGSKPAGRD